MEDIQLRRHFSLDILLRMLVLGAIASGVLYWKIDFINQIYFRNQLTPTGLVINGAILALFAIGLLKMVGSFIAYAREEAALNRFVHNFLDHPREPLHKVAPGSMIRRRYRALVRLSEAHTPINHGALASTLVATESTRNSLPRFINNILILTGVFGTILSLSIALIGASDLLESAVAVSGMGMVVHGMSTALSTTLTAIVCYLYFGYFYLKLNDVQTNLISAVEQVTTQYLLPRFQVRTESVLYEFTGLIRSLQGLVHQMGKSQQTFETIEKHLLHTLDAHKSQVLSLATDLDRIQQTLRSGFRLPGESA